MLHMLRSSTDQHRALPNIRAQSADLLRRTKRTGEQTVGVQLLDRSKRPFVLTDEGSRYYEGCRQLVRQYTKLVDEVRQTVEEMGFFFYSGIIC